MSTIDEVVESVQTASSWDSRINVIRLIPEKFGTSSHQGIYSAIAKAVYVPSLAPDFAYIHWHEDYELPLAQATYDTAHKRTAGFSKVDVSGLIETLVAEPTTLRVFRLILGFTAQEFAAASSLVLSEELTKPLTVGNVRRIEEGRAPKPAAAEVCALVIDRAMRRELFGASPTAGLRLKVDKPDTISGWSSVQRYASGGVPLAVFLHQRQYGGAFRQLLDATSTKRGDILEDAVSEVFDLHGISYVRTGSKNQDEISAKFGITVKPAPDFVVFDGNDTPRAILECKGANDGGTARDKAARFKSLKVEATRLGGIPLFAVLAGLGWTRTADALGPVIRDTDGRTFTIPTLREMMTVQPFPILMQAQF